MTINNRMFALMKEKNIKAIDLANHLNVSKTVISAWKNRGTNPPAEYIVQICELLNISIRYFLTGSDGSDLTIEEQEILKAYRIASPAIKTATKKLLDINKQEPEKSLSSRTG